MPRLIHNWRVDDTWAWREWCAKLERPTMTASSVCQLPLLVQAGRPSHAGTGGPARGEGPWVCTVTEVTPNDHVQHTLMHDRSGVKPLLCLPGLRVRTIEADGDGVKATLVPVAGHSVCASNRKGNRNRGENSSASRLSCRSVVSIAPRPPTVLTGTHRVVGREDKAEFL
jgi:hypothetical protein